MAAAAPGSRTTQPGVPAHALTEWHLELPLDRSAKLSLTYRRIHAVSRAQHRAAVGACPPRAAAHLAGRVASDAVFRISLLLEPCATCRRPRERCAANCCAVSLMLLHLLFWIFKREWGRGALRALARPCALRRGGRCEAPPDENCSSPAGSAANAVRSPALAGYFWGSDLARLW